MRRFVFHSDTVFKQARWLVPKAKLQLLRESGILFTELLVTMYLEFIHK